MSNQELITNGVANMSNEEKALILPPINRANFVVRKNWLGRNQVITFNTKATKTKPSVQVTYNHDEVLEVMLPKLNIMPCWIAHTNICTHKEADTVKCIKIVFARLGTGRHQIFQLRQLVEQRLATAICTALSASNETQLYIALATKVA